LRTSTRTRIEHDKIHRVAGTFRVNAPQPRAAEEEEEEEEEKEEELNVGRVLVINAPPASARTWMTSTASHAARVAAACAGVGEAGGKVAMLPGV